MEITGLAAKSLAQAVFLKFRGGQKVPFHLARLSTSLPLTTIEESIHHE
jgi:hypothetical protein